MSIELPAHRPCAVATAVAIALSPAAASAQSAIEEIVVTATKREESMQDVPVSMTALQSDSLEELRIGTFQDYVQFLPNVVAQGTGPGQNELFIRGAATSQTVLTLSSVQGLQPSVALYLDDQPVAMQGRNLDIYATDLARIEVLPGPQGTLFGASSQAGTVRLITNKPNHSELQAGFDVSYSTTTGGDPSTSLEAYLNVPVSDQFALRLAAYNDYQGGWVDNQLNDPANGGWSGSAVVIDRISGGPLPDPENTAVPLPRNDQLVESNFNDAVYRGMRVGASILFNDAWELMLQH
ncbi:MAG: TonB-dependent receptor plug domain-containing protein, partial [Gammaproteobacteria bacterium]|nr:TonB-dependent receptor plug domain-containing protein [Gammaproteobacteria bacterium]